MLGDLAITSFLQDRNHPGLLQLAKLISLLGNPWLVVATVGISSLGFWVAGLRTDSLFVMGILIPDTLNQGLKILIGRPRPTEDLVYIWEMARGNSFPSGHAFHAILFFGLLIFLGHRYLPQSWSRQVFLGLLGIILVLSGLSRVYLGLHWATDIVGSYTIGGLCLFLMCLLYLSKYARHNET